MLEGIANRVRSAAIAALNDEAEQLAELARSKAPVRKDPRKNRPGGHLRDSIHAVAAEQTGESSWTAEVVTDAPYAGAQEFGTRKNSANPFMRPALEESRESIVAGVQSAVNTAARSGSVRRETRKVVLKLKGRES